MRILTNPRGSWTRYRGSVRLPRLGIGLVATAGALALGLAAIGPVSARTAQVTNTTSSTGGFYVSVTPTRIADTRANSGMAYAGDTLATGTTLQVQVPTSVVPAGATGVVLNVTAVDPSAAGFISVFPGGATVPTGSSLVSNLNFAAGATVANLVTVGLSSTGTVEIYNYTGNTNVVVDVEGYYTSTPASNGSGLYNAMSPVRVMGTLASGQAIAANSTQVISPSTLTAAGVPSSATAVVVNVTAAKATAASFVTVYPYSASATRPTASNLNFGAQVVNQAIANRVTVGVGSGGIAVYNHAGTVNVDVDVNGYYTGSGGTGSTFVAITPQRLTDTRSATNGTPIAASTSETFSLTNSSIPATAAAVAANFTVVPGDAPGYATVYPTSASTNPTASDVNWTASESPAVPNFTVADTAGTGKVAVFNSHGATINLLIDAFGYFGPSNAGTPTMVSAAVTDNSIAITYNEAVSCPATGADTNFAYDWTGTASGGTVTGCTTSASNGSVLDLTGTFTLPAASGGGSITYTAPTATNTTSNSVYATNNKAEFAATETIAISAAVAPTMVSAYTTATTLVITYNEDVTCPNAAGASADFAYNYTGSASGFAGAPVSLTCTSGGPGTNYLTLTDSSGVTAPSSGASVTYTAPTTNSSTASVYATGSVPPLYAKTQTITTFTAPSISGATVTAGPSGTGSGKGEIAVSYQDANGNNANMACPTSMTDLQAEFEYSNGGTPAYPSTCSASGNVLTLGTFYSSATGTTGETLVLPGAADTLTYTAPSATNTTTNSVNATSEFPAFPASQTFDLTATAAPKMVTAAVATAASITITYNEPVSCSAGADGAFTYDSSSGVSGGTATGCASGAGDTLVLSGAFNAPQGSASLTYTAPATSTTSNAVYAAGSTSVFAATQTISGTAFTAAPFTASAPASATAGTPANWTLSGGPSTNGLYTVTVDNATNSPNGAAPTSSATVTFTNGSATVPVTLVDAAAQTLEFTVNGATSTGDTAVTPAAATAAYGEILNSGTAHDLGSDTTAGSEPVAYNSGPWTGPQAFTVTGAVASTTYDLEVQIVDQFGNDTTTGAPSTATVTVASSDSATVNGGTTPASVGLTGGVGTFTYTTGSTAGSTDVLTVTGSGLSGFALSVKD